MTETDENLLHRLLDGQISADESRQLERALSEDPAVAARLQELLALHRKLSDYCSPIRAFSPRELRAIADVEEAFATSGQRTGFAPPPQTADLHRSTRWPVWLMSSLTVAASLALVAWWSLFPVRLAGHAPAVDKVDLAANSVARIVRKVDCQWESQQWIVSPTPYLKVSDRVSLTSGLLVLEFNSGAQVTLCGPCVAMPLGPNMMRLETGNLVAKVPESAHGFTVQTVSGEVVDLGTEFGLSARADGEVETHVFEGEVEARAAGAAANEVISIREGSALAFNDRGASRSIRPRPRMFVKVDYGLDEAATADIPVDRQLALWLAADRRVQLDSRRCAASWGDLPTASNERIQDAWQVNEDRRPRFDPRGINGRPALAFNGVAGLSTEPLLVTGTTTCGAVFRFMCREVPERFQRLPNRADLGLQLLNLYGPPHPVLQFNSDCSLTGRIHLGWSAEKLVGNDVGVTTSPPLDDELPHIVFYVYDPAQSLAQLYVDGRLVAEDGNVPPQPSTNVSRHIGNHPFRPEHGFVGHIAEVLIYNTALTPSEIEATTNWLALKYGLRE